MSDSPDRFHLQVVSGTIMPVEQAFLVLSDVITGGPDSVQVRDHAAPDSAIRAIVDGLREPASFAGCAIVINRRAELAGQLGVSWIHHGATALESRVAFDALGGRRVGVSVHRLDEGLLADSLGADYVTFGNVFETNTHPGVPARGVEALEEIVSALDIPVLAIGGINSGNVDRVVATGCAGVAVCSAVIGAASPARSVRALRTRLDRSVHVPKRVIPRIHATKRM